MYFFKIVLPEMAEMFLAAARREWGCNSWGNFAAYTRCLLVASF